MTASSGYVNDLQCVAAPLVCAWLMATRFHWLNLFPVLAYVGYRAWFGWNRWTIVLFFLMAAVTFCWHRRRLWVPAWTLLAAVPVFSLFTLLGHNRDLIKTIFKGGSMQVVADAAGMTPEEKLRARFDTQDFANFDYLTYVLSVVPERTGDYTYGAQYLQLFTEPIPRALWKDKPIGSPVRTINLMAYGNFNGLTVSLAGDGWMSGGWIGMILTLSLAGSVLGWFHRWFWRHINEPMAAFLFISALSMFFLWFRDGNISIAKFMFWTWLPLLIWHAFAWSMGQRLLAYTAVTLAPGSRLRLIQRAGKPHESICNIVLSRPP
jgi:hypothetical protein